ncbi:MAG: LysM repeat protein [Bradymonadia bacterium]|jgi:LysM repeat protein
MLITCSSEPTVTRPNRHIVGLLLAAVLAFSFVFFSAAAADAGRVRYTVAPGDTLLGIALDYDVSVSDIRRWNELSSDSIFVGQSLTIRTPSGSGERAREDYTVRSGDTGLGIARRLNVSWTDLQRWNSRTNFDRLSVGQSLYYYVDGGGDSRSSGAPNRGRLRSGRQLDSGNGFRVRSGERAWGNELTVVAIQNAISRVQARYIDVPDVVVHDLSYERGGSMTPHRSHQNGRDVDISYYRNDCDDECAWQELEPGEMNVELQWYLFRGWIDQGLVEYIFVERDLQPELYDYAQSRGATEEQLEEWFEMHDGGGGYIRHEPGHDDHFHARFVVTD